MRKVCTLGRQFRPPTHTLTDPPSLPMSSLSHLLPAPTPSHLVEVVVFSLARRFWHIYIYEKTPFRHISYARPVRSELISSHVHPI